MHALLAGIEKWSIAGGGEVFFGFRRRRSLDEGNGDKDQDDGGEKADRKRLVEEEVACDDTGDRRYVRDDRRTRGTDALDEPGVKQWRESGAERQHSEGATGVNGAAAHALVGPKPECGW